ncbi:olfactory receptor 51E2-like [Lampris incognitus]|uniref:olfactory receptor 51E2-like n=1 Tax=Lampris incognitus TaxID=2546036 RepID=UPI0024B5B937|nr:olfactory receptor 51E2-like [Lampris incognitus]
MTYTNFTTVKDFRIIGFPGLQPEHYGPVSALLLLTFLSIVFGNVFILAFVAYERCLHKPTYLIFCHLALTDIAFGFVTLPKIIARYWWDDKVVSFGACFTQMYFVHCLGAIHALILLIMAVDRFIAICIPLRYPVLIRNNNISFICGVCWIFTFIRMLVVLFQALSLPYCNSNIIAQCYCDRISIVRLACKKDQYIEDLAFGFAMFSLSVPLGFIIFSYFAIIISVLKTSRTNGRSKTMSTCTPQIFITSLYFLPRCFVYLAYFLGFKFPNADIRIAVIMLYSLLPAVVNPLIYCFKTKDIKEILLKKLKSVKIGIEIKLNY